MFLGDVALAGDGQGGGICGILQFALFDGQSDVIDGRPACQNDRYRENSKCQAEISRCIAAEAVFFTFIGSGLSGVGLEMEQFQWLSTTSGEFARVHDSGSKSYNANF